MLQITPEALKLIRQATGHWADPERSCRAPVTLPHFREKRRKRKADQVYRRRLIDQTAAILQRGEPSVFAFEGFLRHGLRAGLCLRGWSWSDADDLAADVVRSALHQIGAKRPTYQQGQPEWTQEGVIMVEREYCVRCGWRLPEGKFKFCNQRCSWAYRADIYQRFRAEELEAIYDDAP